MDDVLAAQRFMWEFDDARAKGGLRAANPPHDSVLGQRGILLFWCRLASACSGRSELLRSEGTALQWCMLEDSMLVGAHALVSHAARAARARHSAWWSATVRLQQSWRALAASEEEAPGALEG